MTPYTIRLFMPDGDPQNIKIIDKMNWTGLGLEIYRRSWEKYKNRPELQQAGIYILFGYDEVNDKPTVYIGQGDGIKKRIEQHDKNKDFWEKVLVFVSSNNGLNRAHITWLEWALINKGKKENRCNLDNSVVPTEPVLSESEKADTREFLNEILSILPLVEVKVFEKADKVSTDSTLKTDTSKKVIKDTIIVPAQKEGFEAVFIGEDCWYAIRISAGKINDIKYIAAYQTSPISAVTYYAEVDSIQPYGDGSKYQVNFKGKAIKLDQAITLDSPKYSPQAPVYTSYEKLIKAKTMKELLY